LGKDAVIGLCTVSAQSGIGEPTAPDKNAGYTGFINHQSWQTIAIDR
jgi:hypothetical protein